MSSNTDVLDKPGEEQPHVTDDLFGVGGVGGVGFDPEDTSRARTRSALRGENLPRPTPTYTTNDDMPDTDPPDDDPPGKFVPRDIPDTNAENGEGGDKRDREIELNSDLKKSHMANSESLSRLSRLSHNTDVPDKPAEEQPHISDDTPPPDTVRQLRLQVVGAIKCGDDDSMARLLPRLRQVSEKDYREVCAKYRLTPLNQEQPE
jgi:hypothetical protein